MQNEVDTLSAKQIATKESLVEKEGQLRMALLNLESKQKENSSYSQRNSQYEETVKQLSQVFRTMMHVYSRHYPLSSIRLTVYCIQHEVFCLQCAVCSAQRTAHDIHECPHILRSALHSTQHTVGVFGQANNCCAKIR